MKYILAIDQGTTSSRAIIFNQVGSVIATAQREFAQIFPRPGWVEHDATDIWDTQSGVMQEVLMRARLEPKDIAAIGITNQRETTVVWDRKTGKPIHNAIVWQDRRTAEFCDRLKAQGLQSTIQSKTGLVIDAYFSASKLSWILDNIPEARARAIRGELAFGTIDSWLLWNLTDGGQHVTDPSNASRTMLYNIRAEEWDEELLAIFNIPRLMLPEVRSSSEVYGDYRGIPIAGIAGDQQAALFGQCCHQPGMVKNTYGTGCFMLMNTGRDCISSKSNLLTTVAWRIAGQTEYALEGSVFMAGAVVQWLRDGLKIIKSSAEIESLAGSVPDTGGVYLVPAFVGLGAPHWDQYARGTIVGLTRGTTSAHLARAAEEGIALQVADILAVMEHDSGIRITELRVDGGAARDGFLMQIQSDLLNVPVVRPKITETTALGAAYLAGLAVGVWKDRQEMRAQWQADQRYLPQMTESQRNTLKSGWAKALTRSRNWVDPA